jgi:predicted Fe-Mo cluster-binding NifX family protein
MNNLKPVLIAVPTNDGATVFPKMLGMARYFYIYETLDVYAVIRDCEIIISAVIGKKGIERLRAKGVKLFFRKGEINDALNIVLENGEDAR